MLVPKGTPDAIVQRLNQATNDGLRSPEMSASLQKIGLEAVIQTYVQTAEG